MPSASKNRHLLLRGLLKISRWFVVFFALPIVRNFVWNRVAKKAEEKILDVEAKIVGDTDEEKKLM